MHACSSIIEHSLHSIYQPFPSTHPSLVITASPSHSQSAIAQFQLPLNHPLPVSLTAPNISNQLLLRPIPPLNNHSLSPIEIRLFHTLHYLLLYSNDNHDQLLPLNIIQLFIYLFLPYIQTYFRHNEKEFLSNSDLLQGMRFIWQPLFEYHQPNIRIFNAFVKPVQSSDDQQQQQQQRRLSIVIESPVNEIKPSTFILTESDPTTTTTQDSATDLEGYEILDSTKFRAPLVHMNSICSVSDLSRLTVSPQSAGKYIDFFVLLKSIDLSF
jgi:hypothetical protein